MLNDKTVELRKKLSSLFHTLLPMLAPFFLQVASSTYLMNSLPLPAALGSAVGLLISYLFGPIGFFVSAASWGTYLALEHPELLKNTLSLLFLSSCVVSWWLSTLCSEQYQQKIVDFEEMIASLFKKHNEFEKQAKEALLTLKEERKNHEKQTQDLDTQLQDLQHQLSSHRHHLSLAWQESSMLKEEGEKQRRDLTASYESSQSQSMFYLQQKQMAESALEQAKGDMEKLKKEKDEKQNQFLEEFNILKQKIEEARAQAAEKESELLSLHNQMTSLQTEREAERASLKEQMGAIQAEKESEISMLKEQMNTLQAKKEQQISQPSNVEGIENTDTLQYWEMQYKQLRAQFDEKSDVLNETRKELFSIENQLLTLQKQEEDLAHDENEEQKNLISHLQNLELECSDLEDQVELLQDIVSSLQEKKKVTRSKKTKTDAEASIEKLLETSQKSESNLFTLSE